MKTDRTAPKRVREYTARNKSKGLVRVIVWIPRDRVEELRAEADRLRKANRYFGGEAPGKEESHA